MEEQLIRLSQLFHLSLFRIPDFQRGYAWTNSQLEDFWNDIDQLQDEKDHYIGVLTLDPVPEEIYSNWEDDCWIIKEKKYSPYYIVDGQQRLTTIIILIQVIIEYMQHIDKTRHTANYKINYSTREEIQKQYIYESRDDGITRSYMFGYEKDNPSYEYLKTKIFKQRSSSNNYEETTYTHNLDKAKKFFDKKIKNIDDEAINILFKKITQHVLFNIFSITKEIDVCVTFETMNNRGKPLSYLELLKNRLIYLSIRLKDKNDMLKTNLLRRDINNCWKTIYHNLGKNLDNRLTDDSFLYYHTLAYFDDDLLTSYDKQLDKKRRVIIRDIESKCEFLLKHQFITKNISTFLDSTYIHNYADSIALYSVCWYKLWNPQSTDYSEEIKNWIERIAHMELLRSTRFLPFILNVLSKHEDNPDVLLKTLKTVERYYFIEEYMNYYTDNDILDINNIYKKNPNIDETMDRVEEETIKIIKGIDKINTMDRVLDYEGYSRRYLILYILIEYEIYIQENSYNNIKKIDWSEFRNNKFDVTSIEHIFPQNPKDKYWVDRFGFLSSKDQKRLSNSLGNLLPLSRQKNSSLNNRSFPDKKISKSGMIGYSNGTFSENEVALADEWTPKQIIERGLKLLDFVEKRWKINLGDRDHKMKILGLEEIEKKLFIK